MNKKLPLTPIETDALLYVILSVLLLFSVNQVFSQSQLLQDINQKDDNLYNEYSSLKGGSQRLYFVSEGKDLYSSEMIDGLEVTKKIKSFVLNVGNLVLMGSTLYFTADDGVSGTELWKTDGTEIGTSLVKDIRAGSAASFPETLIDVNGMLYFVANNGTNGKEVWRSNGTASGTVLVKDVFPKSGSSNPTHLTNVNGTLFFAANDGVHGYELWKSNGAAEGTKLVKDIRTESKVSSSPDKFAAAGNLLFFTATESATGRELWKTDGTEEGTVLVKDIRAGTGTSSIDNSIGIQGVAYFTASDGISGQELWRSDGTETGTYLLKDMTPGSAGSHGEQAFSYQMGNFTNINGHLFYTAYQGNEYYIWKSDGTTAGTVTVQRCSGPGISQPKPQFKLMNGYVYYFNYSDDEYYSYGLFRVNAQGSAPQLLYALVVDGYDNEYPLFTVAGNMLYFSTRYDYYTTGFTIFRSNGNPGGTQPLGVDTYSATKDSNATNFTKVNGKVVFTAQVSDEWGWYYENLYATDGTPAGTIQINEGGGWSDVNGIVTANNQAYVSYNSNLRILKTDGSVEGTHVLAEDNTVSANHLTYLNGNLYHSNYYGELWKINVMTGERVMMRDFYSITSISSIGTTLLVRVTTENNGEELWRSNGTTTGTYKAKTLHAEVASPAYLYPTTQIKNTHFFIANDGTHGNELWRTQGTGASTYMVTDLNLQDDNFKVWNYNEFDISTMTSFRDSLYISAVDPTGKWALLKTNGTATGFKKVIDLNPVQRMTPIGNNAMLMTVYRDSERSQIDLWVTDGTASGTKLLKQLGTLYYLLTNIEVVAGKGLFMIDREMWTSDGTECGTYATNLGTHSQSQFAMAGNNAVFSGHNRDTGYEPHAFNLNQIEPAPCDALVSANAFGDAEVFGRNESMVRQAPNPFVNDFSLTISGSENETAHVEVYTLAGVAVERFSDLSCNVEYHLGNSWKTGMYIMQVNKSGERHTEKIIKR